MCRNSSKGATSLVVLLAVGLYIASIVTRRWAKITSLNGAPAAAGTYLDIWAGDDANGVDLCSDTSSRICQGLMATRGFVLLALLISVVGLAAMNWKMKFAGFLYIIAAACGIISVAAFRGVVMEKLAEGAPPIDPQGSDLWYSTGIAIAGLLVNFIAGFLSCGYHDGTSA